LRFGLAVGLTIAALAVRAAFDPYLGNLLPYLTFFVAVTLTAYLEGFAPSLLSIVLGYFMARWFFIEPRFTFRAPNPGTRLNTIAYFAGSVLICGMTALMSRARVRAETMAVELARRQRQLEAEIVEREAVERALREADRRKDEFLAVLSHELRNPLAPIRNAQYVLEHTDPTTEQAALARDIIGRQVGHLARMVDDLLDATRISRGRVQVQRARLDLVAVARRAVEDHRSLFLQRDLTMDFRAPDNSIWVDGDVTRLSQVMGNLLHNAQKFTDGGGHVVVSVERLGREAVVSVRDSGVGIPREVLDVLFEPFEQADRTIHRSRGGLGLGLALVRAIVELHGGTVRARSEGDGRGAELVVTLPVAGDAAADSPAPGGDQVALHASFKRRILIIEDNGDSAVTLRNVLELHGHEVHLAGDGLRGVEAARRLRPDVVVCDLGLPGIDGYEVARRLRASGDANAAMLVALTGYASAEDVGRAVEAGFHHHLAKPPDLTRLVQILGAAAAPRRTA
jgi:two-component system CheB/CheR fusion protein